MHIKHFVLPYLEPCKLLVRCSRFNHTEMCATLGVFKWRLACERIRGGVDISILISVHFRSHLSSVFCPTVLHSCTCIIILASIHPKADGSNL